jgi:hypothetical protein
LELSGTQIINSSAEVKLHKVCEIMHKNEQCVSVMKKALPSLFLCVCVCVCVCVFVCVCVCCVHTFLLSEDIFFVNSAVLSGGQRI